MITRLRPWLACCTLVLSACGGGGGSSGGGNTPPAPAVSLSPTSLSFASQAVGTTSAGQSVTVTNSGTASLSISSITLGGTNAADFAQTSTCASSLAAGASCTVTVTYTPSAAGTSSASVALATNAAGSPTSIALSGTGVTPTPALTLSTTALSLTSNTLGAPGAGQTVTLTDSGNAPLTLTGITISGSGAAGFTQSSTCGSTLAVAAQCTVTVTYTPAGAGAVSATLAVTSDAPTGTNTVALTGAYASATSNSVPITIDSGPPAVTTANIAYVTLTVCTPGSTSQCATIDHIQVDTGSYGLRLFASEIGSVVPTPVTDALSGQAINECVVYADGYTWGSVGAVDVTIGGRTIGGVAAQVLGSTSVGSPPNSCSHTGTTSNGTYENTVTSFGARGLIGIGPFAQDCGVACAQQALVQWYYTCPNGACSPVAVPLATQVQNPITLLGSDNNGVVIDLPAVPAGLNAQNTLQGTLYFGVGTQSNNTPPGTAEWYTLDGQGLLITTYAQTDLPNSFIDLGSNGLFFGDKTITACQNDLGFYCPSNPLNLAATITGQNGAQTTANFTVDNAETDFNVYPTAGVFPHLAGDNSSPTAPSQSFDWGSPFYFGRRVYHLIENQSVGTITGPALAF